MQLLVHITYMYILVCVRCMCKCVYGGGHMATLYMYTCMNTGSTTYLYMTVCSELGLGYSVCRNEQHFVNLYSIHVQYMYNYVDTASYTGFSSGKF